MTGPRAPLRGCRADGIGRVAALAIALAAAAASCAEPPPGSETVLLVHGLGRTAHSMALLGIRLEAAGYRVVPFDYPSTSETIEQLSRRLAAEVVECCAEQADDVHFVTHSMGGILVWRYLSDRPREHRGRVVMLSPPARGSEIVDALAGSPLFESLVGPAGVRLGTDSGSVTRELPPVRFELGVITGDRTLNPITSWLIPGPDDGKVGVAAARVEGASDFLVLPANHTFIMNEVEVAEQVVHFLRQGRFGHMPD